MKRIIAAKTDDRITDIERRNRELAREAAREGIVLLENDGTLPLKPCKIALYGTGAKNTVKGGTGSGEVNVRHSVSIYEGLKNVGFTILSERSLEICDGLLKEARRKHEEEARAHYSVADAFAIVFTIPEDNAVSEDELCDCDTAIYVLARQSGEGKDRRIEGNFKLNPNEISSLKLLRKHYKKVILVINAGSSQDLSEVEDLGLNAVIFFCQEGEEGGNALADLLTGKENFSGKLTDTWVKSYADVPFGNEFSYLNGDVDREYYREGIYVGYRYYDSFNIPVRYHFGYGLSYTSFDIETEDISLNKDEISLKVRVTNTGKYPGKEVIQVYVSCPEGRLDKEFQRLVSFKKISVLKPSESETISLSFKMSYCASFDEENDSFILEKGNYIIRTGNSSDSTKALAYISNKEDIILSRHRDILGNGSAFKDLKSPSHRHDVNGLKELILDSSVFKTETYEYEGFKPLHDERVEKIISSLTPEEKILAVTGEERENRRPLTDYVFTPGSVARTTEKLIGRGVINTNLADGPAGLRLLNKSFLE